MTDDEYIAAQERANKALCRHAKAIARDCETISSLADGNCGYIIDQVIEHLREAGLYRDPQREKQKKKKIPAWLRKQVFERDAYRCVKCGDHHDLEADHIYPESLGGETTVDNLQTMCKPCNGKKSNKVDS